MATKKKKIEVLPEDILTGLAVVLDINVPEPAFDSQAKVKLSGPEVEKAIYTVLVKEFKKYLNNLTPEQTAKLKKHITDNVKIRQAAELAKISKKKSIKSKNPANLPSKLHDCKYAGDELAELYIAEGASALGSILNARDAELQAAMPIRGKILNVLKLDLHNKKQLKRFNDNAEVADIIKALGCGIGEHCDLDKLRYGKICIACDSDQDGFDISVLLLGLFWKLFKPVVKAGHIYQICSPLLEIKYKTKDGQQVEYAENRATGNKIEEKLKKKGIKYTVDYVKGLGELSSDAFSDYVLNPANRRMIQVTVDDVKAAEDMIQLAIGDRPADDRKEWMLDHYDIVEDSIFTV